MSETLDRRLFDRRLFMAVAVLFPLIILAGFARTYYLKGLFGTPPLASMVVHLHGVLMTMWIALFVTQVWLIRSRQIRVHQRLGYAGIGLAVLIIGAGLVTAIRAAKFGSASTPPGIAPQAFLIVPLFDLLMFAIFFGGAVYYRKSPAQHKALMLLTAIYFLPPALDHIPIASLQAIGPLWFFGFPTALALLAIGIDRWRHGKLNRMLVGGTLLLLASYIGRLALMGTDAWMGISRWLTSFV